MALVNSNFNRLHGKNSFQEINSLNIVTIPDTTEDSDTSMPKEGTPSSGKSSLDSNFKKRKLPQAKKPAKTKKTDDDFVPAEVKILSYNIDPYDFKDEDEATLIEYAVAMFKHFDLLQEFGIEEDSLRVFFQEVRVQYNPDNSFHNFKHVWCVMHMSFQLLLLGGSNYLEPFDMLAVLIAAICHDMSHPGNSNAFEVATHSDISKKYSSKKENYTPILEQHHASLTETLLKGSVGRAMLSKLSPDQFKAFLAHVNQIIMATDMAKHHQLVQEAEAFRLPPVDASKKAAGGSAATPAHPDTPIVTPRARCSSRLAGIHINKSDPEVRLRLTRVLVHSADIGAQTQCLEYAYRWVHRMYNEFRSQAVKEKHLGIMTSPFLHDISSEAKKFANQCDFITSMVEPIWLALSEILPELRFAYNQLLANKAEYRDRVVRESDIEAGQGHLNMVTSSSVSVVESGSSSGANSRDEHE